MNGPKFPENLEYFVNLNDIKNLNGSRNVLNFLNLLVFEWFEYVELCGSSLGWKKLHHNNKQFLCTEEQSYHSEHHIFC